MRTIEFVESYFDAWNQHDPEGVAEHLAADGVYLDVPERVSRTHDELVQSLADFFAEHAHRYELIGEIVSGPGTIAFQYQILRTGNAHGRSYSGAEFITLCGDAAETITDYYDLPVLNRSTARPRPGGRRNAGRKYAKSGLSDSQMLALKRRLEDVMQQDRVYLESSLTLPRLAKCVGCSVNHLSQVINAGFGMSFFDYVNRYRVQHAKALLCQGEQRNAVILNIAFAVGFNSNSAFYSAFRKCVGQTPAQYRNQQLNRLH